MTLLPKEEAPKQDNLVPAVRREVAVSEADVAQTVSLLFRRLAVGRA